MKSFQRSWLCAGTALLALAMLCGCGSSETKTIPTTATLFYAHSAFLNHTAGRTVPMTVGYNAFGQLGNGTITTPFPFARPVSLLPTSVSGISAGGVHTMAYGNNSVFVWGSNNHGQLGLATISTTGSSAFSAVPITINMGSPVADIAAGGYHSLAVVNNKVIAWGYNGFGQLGDTTAVDKPTPIETSLLTNATKVAAGGTHSLALTADQKVFAWGNNANGQLGYVAANTFSTFPQPVLTNISTAQIGAIAAGGSSSYALDSTGTKLWGWGYNAMGQLGDHVALSTANPTPISLPSAVTVTNPITRISAGLDHLLILLQDHTVWGIGFNGDGQLGNGGTFKINNTFVQVVASNGTPLSGVSDIVAIGNHSLAKASGIWVGWGDNGSGQLGNPVATTSVGFLLHPTTVIGSF